MVKTKGPLFGVDASGTVGKTITHSSWKGRTYAKTHAIPANPSTAAMVSVRAGMKFLTATWSLLHVAHQQTWSKPATAEKISPFNAYLAHNLERMGRFLPPVSHYPDPTIVPAGSLPFISIKSGVRNIKLTGPIAGGTDNWAIQLFRSQTSGFTPARGNLIVINGTPGLISWNIRDTPLDPGTYYYRAAVFNETGDRNILATEVSGTAT